MVLGTEPKASCMWGSWSNDGLDRIPHLAISGLLPAVFHVQQTLTHNLSNLQDRQDIWTVFSLLWVWTVRHQSPQTRPETILEMTCLKIQVTEGIPSMQINTCDNASEGQLDLETATQKLEGGLSRTRCIILQLTILFATGIYYKFCWPDKWSLYLKEFLDHLPQYESLKEQISAVYNISVCWGLWMLTVCQRCRHLSYNMKLFLGTI